MNNEEFAQEIAALAVKHDMCIALVAIDRDGVGAVEIAEAERAYPLDLAYSAKKLLQTVYVFLKEHAPNALEQFLHGEGVHGSGDVDGQTKH